LTAKSPSNKNCKTLQSFTKFNILKRNKKPQIACFSKSNKMNKSISKILMAITVLLSATACNAQIKNAKTEAVKIYGNCGMCEKTIEKAGNLKGLAELDWNEDTKIASLTYDAKKTNPDEILKRVALAGYDSDSFLAPEQAYSNLPGCCQYDRVKKTLATTEEPKAEIQKETIPTETQEVNQLKPVFDAYFLVKDALVKTDGSTASAKAKELLDALNSVKMGALKSEEHVVWMKVMNELKEDAEHISETKDAGHQRDHFMTLSKNIYALIKVSKIDTPIYYQFCPMANKGKGANWLSKENAVKNPYYGSQMLSCGKTIETIK
jgi:copper chaperone CopZ